MCLPDEKLLVLNDEERSADKTGFHIEAELAFTHVTEDRYLAVDLILATVLPERADEFHGNSMNTHPNIIDEALRAWR